MRAIVLHEFGPAGNLMPEDLPDPVPGPGQVRIVVRAAGVHTIETAMREGLAIGPPLPELPAVFGGEVSGTVDAVGPDVDPAWIGKDVVTGGGSPGGYAELAVADVVSLHEVPEGLGHRAAVAMITTGRTAVEFLDIAQLTPDDVVLVTSAAGGIGWLVVQYGLDLGATVVAAAGGPIKTAAVRNLGATVAVDYNAPGWGETVREALGGRRVTAVLDGVGGAKAREAFELLADGGRFVSIGASSREDFEPDPELVESRDLTVTDALALLLTRPELSDGTQERALASAAEGRMVPAIQVFPLEKAAQAHAALESRATSGKVVLEP
ncbi:zinc-binding dehydrogenase [Nonomuraea typhae]|uniref:Zinc-binding dehydrogenase n=1 Tax=Nonomuraea typhae TaxID=2603600 RepID=A0ABW7Z9R5_9ACTN